MKDDKYKSCPLVEVWGYKLDSTMHRNEFGVLYREAFSALGVIAIVTCGLIVDKVRGGWAEEGGACPEW